MKDWELTLRIVALGHRITAESGLMCPRCGRTLHDILDVALPCLTSEPEPAPASADPAGERDQPEG